MSMVIAILVKTTLRHYQNQIHIFQNEQNTLCFSPTSVEKTNM